MVTQSALALLEFLRIAPKGSLKTCRMLAQGAEALVAGARAGIFTPAFFILARRP
jgi:sterol 24-C-methyltransferase